MTLRRIGKIDVQAKVSGNDIVSTGFVFYSYAKNSNALEFHFKDQQGKAVDLLGTTVRLLLIIKENGTEKEFKTLDGEIVTESSLNGIVRYIVPDRLMGYQGIVDGWIYLDFPDGSKTDEVHFKFTIERSKIDDAFLDAGEFYIKDFEEIKNQVNQSATEAMALIDSIKDSYWQGWDDFQSQAEAEWENWKSQQITKQSKFESDTNVYLNRIETKVDAAQADLTQLKQEMHLSEAWSNSPDGTVDFSRTKPRSTATPWTSAPSDSTLENEFSKYYGLALTDSNDPADYVWVESPEYTRYKAQINSEDLMLSWHTGQQITKRHLIDFKGKVPGSTVENCNIVKYSTTLTPSNTGGWEVIQSNYNNISTLDGTSWRIAIADDQKRTNTIFSFNLVEQVNRDYPGLFESVGADILAKQIAFLKANITCLKSNIWGYGVSPSGNKLTLALWSDNGWYSAKSHTASDIQQLTNELTTNIGIRIQNDGFVYALAYAEPSDGTIASTINIDYASLEYTLSFKKSDFDISKDQYAKDLGEIKEWIAAHS